MGLLVAAAVTINGTEKSSFAVVFATPVMPAILQLMARHVDRPQLTTRILAAAGIILMSCSAYCIHWIAPEHLRTPSQGPLWASAACAVAIPVLYGADALWHRRNSVE